MKIAFFIDSMNGFGGAQRVISVLCNHFSKEGNEVLLVMTGNTDKSVYPLENVRTYAYAKTGKIAKLKKLWAIRRRVKAFGPDVAVSFLTMTNIMAILALMGTGIPLIISERNDPSKCTPREKKLSRRFYPRAAGIVVQTGNIQEQLRQIYQGNMQIIPNPLQKFDYEKTDYTASRKMIAVGRITDQKNYPLLLEAFAGFLAKHDGWKLHIYGTGEKLEAYQALARQLGIWEHACFMGNKPEPWRHELDAQIYVMSSDYEGMPNALAEAMSLGFPCVCTDCDGGGAAWLIRDGENGILVEKGNAAQLTQAMERLAEDPELAERLGTGAKALGQTLAVENIVRCWTDFIKQFIK